MLKKLMDQWDDLHRRIQFCIEWDDKEGQAILFEEMVKIAHELDLIEDS